MPGHRAGRGVWKRVESVWNPRGNFFSSLSYNIGPRSVRAPTYGAGELHTGLHKKMCQWIGNAVIEVGRIRMSQIARIPTARTLGRAFCSHQNIIASGQNERGDLGA